MPSKTAARLLIPWYCGACFLLGASYGGWQWERAKVQKQAEDNHPICKHATVGHAVL